MAKIIKIKKIKEKKPQEQIDYNFINKSIEQLNKKEVSPCKIRVNHCNNATKQKLISLITEADNYRTYDDIDYVGFPILVIEWDMNV